MIGKIIGLVALPIDVASDVLTLGGSLTNEKSATMKKLDYITGKEEQERKDLETFVDITMRMKGGK